MWPIAQLFGGTVAAGCAARSCVLACDGRPRGLAESAGGRGLTNRCS